MKRSVMYLGILLLTCAMSSLAQYVSTTRARVPIHTTSGEGWHDPNFSAYANFDVEAISSDGFLDLAVGQNIRDASFGIDWFGFQSYNDGSGSFPSFTDFFINWSPYENTMEIYNAVFGKLRPDQPRKDLAIPRKSGTQIHYNTGNGITGTPSQTLTGIALDASWGPFSSSDGLHDLAITTGSQVKIYRNLGNGYVDANPYSFAIAANKVALAQLNRTIYSTDPDKWDLVTTYSSGFSIRLNNNSNGFGAPQNISNGYGINSFAVGDVNNDGYQDILVGFAGGTQSVALYLNNGAGTIGGTPIWTADVTSTPLVAIGDLGAPNDGTKNDGWNDIVVVGYEGIVKVFINQKTGNYFLSSPQQTVASVDPYTPFTKAVLADVQNLGGLSVISSSPGGGSIGWEHPGYIEVLKHLGNPKPAPPKNLIVQGVVGQHPTLQWQPNSERDLSGYKLYRKVSPGESQYQLIATLGTGTWQYTDPECVIRTGGTGGSWAQYYVIAYDAANNMSDASNIVSSAVNYNPRKSFADGTDVPTEFFLGPNYPNPFNPSTTLDFGLPKRANVTLQVYDLLGREIAVLARGLHEAGYHTVTWNASSSPSGVYFARFYVADETGQLNFSKVNKLLLAK